MEAHDEESPLLEEGVRPTARGRPMKLLFVMVAIAASTGSIGFFAGRETEPAEFSEEQTLGLSVSNE